MPVFSDRTFVDPVHSALTLTMTRLIAIDIQPVLVGIRISNPGPAVRMLGYYSRMFVTKHAPADILPPLFEGFHIPAITSQNPDHVIATIPGDHVACQ